MANQFLAALGLLVLTCAQAQPSPAASSATVQSPPVQPSAPPARPSEQALRAAADEAIAKHGERSAEGDRALTVLMDHYYYVQQPAEMAVVAERLLVIRRAMHGNESLVVARTLGQVGAAYGINREPHRELPYELEALAIRERLQGPEHADIASILSNLGRTYRVLSRYAEARSTLTRALDMNERLKGPDDLFNAFTLSAIGDLYMDVGETVSGLNAYRRGLSILEKQPTGVHGSRERLISTALGRLADAQMTLGDLDAAWTTLQRDLALAVQAEGETGPNLRRSLRDNGSMAVLRGDYEVAFALLERSRLMALQLYGPAHSNLAQTLGSLGALYQRVGDPARAVALHRQALDIDLEKVGPGQALVSHRRRLLAGALLDNGDLDGARRELEAALESRQNSFGNDHLDVAIIRIALARLAREDDAVAAREHLAEVRRVLARQPGAVSIWSAAADLEQAELELAIGQPAEALRVAANGSAEAVRAASPDLQARMLELMATASEALGERGPALFWRKQAVNRIQSFRPGATQAPADLQRQFLASRRGSFVRLAAALASAGRLAEAAEAVAMLKEEELGHAVSRAPTADPRQTRMAFPDPAEMLAERRRQALVDELVVTGNRSTRSRIAVLLGERTEGAPEAAAAEADWTSRSQAWRDFVQSVRVELAGIADPLKPRTSDGFAPRLLTQVRDSALLHYVVTDRGVVVLVSTRRGQTSRLIEVAPAELHRRVLEFRIAIQSRKEASSDARELYRILIQPIAADLERSGASTLLLSLDSSLRYLPFAALHDGRKFLAERYALAIYNPASPGSVGLAPPASLSLIGLGSTRGDADLLPLPGVGHEMGRLRDGPLPATVYLDDAFTRPRLIAATASGSPVVHIASHFSLKPGALSTSYLLLGDGSRLTMQEIRDGTLSFRGIDQLTLSACDTAAGAGVDERGSEIESFAALAQRMGARSVLATLWPVMDDTTAAFMGDYYRERSRANAGKAVALQKTQIAAIRRGAPAYAWAPYVLMGNPR